MKIAYINYFKTIAVYLLLLFICNSVFAGVALDVLEKVLGLDLVEMLL